MLNKYAELTTTIDSKGYEVIHTVGGLLASIYALQQSE
jgi:hypothetical protein